MEPEDNKNSSNKLRGSCRVLQKDFVSMSLEEKQETVERLFSNTRRKLHPLIRMDDLLDHRKSSTVQNIVSDMSKHIVARNKSVWYNIPVGLDRERHVSSAEGWQNLLIRLQECVKESTAALPQFFMNSGSAMQWKMDLFPATTDFVVDHVINEGSQFRKPRTFHMNSHEATEAANLLGVGGRRARPPMHHEPIYHMYIECRLPLSSSTESSDAEAMEKREDEVEHMDVMYSRWAVQNPMLLRQRIIERMGTELLLLNQTSSAAEGRQSTL